MNAPTNESVAHLKAGDHVVAEFRELTKPPPIDGWSRIGEPTGRTYVLKGALKEYDGYPDPEPRGLAMPNGQSVRQACGEPGGNMVRILRHIPSEELS